MTMTGVLKYMYMKIWRNDKRIIRSSQYICCEDCALVGEELDYCFECLARLYGICDSKNVCLYGYEYETDV